MPLSNPTPAVPTQNVSFTPAHSRSRHIKVPKAKQLIGRRDRADFPELGLYDIAIKVDTGAYTSAMHCTRIKVTETDQGVPAVSFVLLDPGHPEYDGRVYTFTNFRQKLVRSSNGSSEHRFVIKTKIRLFERDYPIELSLSERGEMRYPVLIGRRLLMRRFIVDPQLVDLSASALAAAAAAADLPAAASTRATADD